MADPIVSILLEKLVTYLIDEGSQLLEFEDQLDEIKKEFQYMQNYIKDADRVKRKDRSETLKLIMNDVRELIYEAEEIIADCQLMCQKKKKQGWTSASFSPTLLKSRYDLVKKLKNVNKSIKQVKQNMISYLATVPVHAKKEESENISLTHPILISNDNIVGLEDESMHVINSLLMKKDHLKVLGIVGMGGIGKTTLAQKICKSETIETEFQPLIFVTVSQNFRFDDLLKKMLDKAGVANGSLHGKGVDDLLKILKDQLDHDKYLIVLDDVWGVEEGQWWYSLDSALPRGKGGCVMVTTRNEEVARFMGATDEHIHRVEILSNKNSWLLFCKVAFARNRGICPDEELEKYGKEIVAECGGLPLTIRVVGGMMLAKGYSINQWKQMAKNLEEEMVNSRILDELVNSRLQLSYEELPMNIRARLLCFIVFPEDYQTRSSQIIQIWIAEGLVCGRRGKTASEIGEECLNEMCNRCLISKDEAGRFGSGVACYTMHDAVREMLIKIATEDSFISINEVSKLSRRIVIHDNLSLESYLTSRLRMLLAFDIEPRALTPILEENLKRLHRLRTFCLRFSNEITEGIFFKSTEWVHGIGSLRHLVYLYFNNVYALMTLPDSIGDLCNLRILSITSCHNLEGIPPSITKLENLIMLDVRNCEKLECLPKGLGKLSNLEHLWCIKSFDPFETNKWLSLSELKDLKKLRLLTMEISTGEQIGEKERTPLQMPESLQILGLGFVGITSGCKAEIIRKINCQLCHPLLYLKELYLDSYPGECTPTWLSPTSLPNLCHLQICYGRIKKMGPGFFVEGASWKVETLVLGWMKQLEDDWAMIESAMPFLRHAYVQKCPRLKYSDETFQPDRHGWITWKKSIKGESSSSLLAA